MIRLIVFVVVVGFASVWFFAQPAAFQSEFLYPFIVAWHFIQSNWILSGAFTLIVIVALLKILL